MPTVGDNTIVLNVPPGDQVVCVLFRNKDGKVVSQHVIFPPNSQTGYHEASADYSIEALTDVALEREDRDGKPLAPLTMKRGETYNRNAADAKHNVKNASGKVVVLGK